MASPFAVEGAKLLRLGLLKDAAAQFEKGLQAEPRDAECLLGLSRCRLAQRRLDDAKVFLLRLEELKPGVPEVHVHLARIAFEQGDKAAVQKLRALAARKEAAFPEFYNLGLTLADLGELDEAAQAFTQALDVVPESPYAFFNLGLVMRRKGELDRALKCFKMARQLAPNELQPYLLISSTLVAKGDVATAAKALTKAIEVLPHAWPLYEELVKVALYANAPKQAVRAAIELRTRRPEDPNAMYLHALALAESGDVDHAKSVLDEALQKLPGQWQLELALGKIQLIRKDAQGAREAFQRAHAAAPSEPGPTAELSTLLLTQGNAAEARALLEEGLRATPEDPGLNLNMALALRTADTAKAKEHAQKAAASGEPSVREQAERLLELIRGAAPRA